MRIGKWMLIVALALSGLLLIAVNIMLNTGAGRRLMNSSPKDVRVNYTHAWMLWPGRVHVKDADISGQDSENQFWVTADYASMSFTPWGLRTKDVTGKNVQGSGVSIRIRKRLLKMPAPKEFAKLPEIKYFPSPLKPDAPDVRVIGVRLQDMKASHVREIWVDAYHVTGDITAEGGMYYKPRRAAKVYPSKIVINTAAVVTGEQPVASQLHGTVAIEVEQLDLSDLSLHAVKAVTTNIDLHLLIDSLRFLNDMLSSIKGVSVDDGAAAVAIAVKMDQGELKEGTEIQLKMPQVQVGLPLFRAHGGVNLDVKVDAAEKHAVIGVQLESLVLNQRGNGKADVRSKIIRIHGHTANLDLTKTPAVEMRADFPDIVAGDLTFVNDFVPEGTAIHIEKGAAMVHGHVNVNSAKHHMDGLVDIEATKLSIKNASAHLWGGVKVHGLINSLDLKSLITNVSGSWLALEDLTIDYDKKQVPNWGARVDLEHCVLHPEGKHKVDTTVKVYIKNLQPIVGVISANIKVPAIAKALTNLEDVRVDAHVSMEGQTLAVTKMEAKNDKFSVQGQAVISDLQKKQPHKDAFILIKIIGLSIGIDIKDESIKPILINAGHWYEERLAASSTPK